MNTTVTGTRNITQDVRYHDDVIFDDALLNISADVRLALAGDDQLSNSTLAMSGVLRNLGLLEVNGLTLENGVTLANAGTLTQTGTVTLGASSLDGAVERNLVGATWTLADSAGVTGVGAGSRFINLGRLQTTDDNVIAVNFYDVGTLDVLGKLTLQAPEARFFGAVEGAGAVTADDVKFIGASIDVANFSAASAHMHGDDTASGATLSISKLVLVNATLTLAGDDTLGGVSDHNSPGAILVRGQGVIDVSGALTLGAPSFYGTSDGYQLTLAQAAFENAGRVSVVGATVEPGEFETYSAATLVLRAQAQIVNEASGVWNDYASDTTYNGTGSFENLGTFTENDNGRFNLDVVNDGLIDMGPVEPGAIAAIPWLLFDGAISGSGKIDVSAGMVTLAAPIASTETLDFVPASQDQLDYMSPTLEIDDPKDFAALVTDFDQKGATYDQIVVNAAGWAFAGFSANSAGGELMFTDGLNHSLIQLAGAFDPLGFHSALSGNATTITYAAP